MGKYADYFKSNEILLIPEILQKIEPRIVSLVVTDLKSRRLVGLKKEGFEDLLRKAGVPCQYFCRKSFATWDVLLPSSDQAAKVASSNINTKFFLRRLGSFLDASRRTVLVGDWNAILDPNIDRAGRGASSWARCDSGLSDFLTEFDLVDRYRLDHPGREIWTWIGSSPSGQVRSYLGQSVSE